MKMRFFHLVTALMLILMDRGASAQIQWQMVYGGTGNDLLVSLVPTGDGGCLLAGVSSSPITGNKTATNYGSTDYWAAKVDSNGTKIWDHAYGGTGSDSLTCALPVTGGFLLGGNSLSGISGNKATAGF